MMQRTRNKIACRVVNCLYYKLPFAMTEEKLRMFIVGTLANRSKPPYYIHWDHKEGGFKPGKKKDGG